MGRGAAVGDIDLIEIDTGSLVFTARASGPVDGRAVFLLHGFPQTSYSWRHVLPALGAAGFRAIAPDQRGYAEGARPDGVEHYRMANLVGDVLAMADRIGADRFDVVGHDWGGGVAWYLAGVHPERLHTVTAVSTPHPQALTAVLEASAAGGGGDQAERSSYMQVFRQGGGVAEAALLGPEGDGAGLRALYAASGLDPAESEEYVRVLTRPGALTAALNWYRAVDRSDVGSVGSIGVPTLYIWSTADVALGREAAEATAGHVGGPYRFEVLEGVSHWVPEEAADDVSRLLLEHFAAHS